MDMPTDWVALVYKEIIADENAKVKILASLFGININDKKIGNKKKNNTMTKAQMKDLGFGYKRER